MKPKWLPHSLVSITYCIHNITKKDPNIVVDLHVEADKKHKSQSLCMLADAFCDLGKYFYAVAYLDVHSCAVLLYPSLFCLNTWAISGTRGSSGLGSVNSEQIDSNTLEMVSAGLHWSFKISRQMLPLLLMLG